MLIDKDMNKTDLHNATGVCASTIAKMAKGADVTVSTLSRICAVLECNIGDIVDLEVPLLSDRAKKKSSKVK